MDFLVKVIKGFILNPPAGLIILGIILTLAGTGGIGAIPIVAGIAWLIIKKVQKKNAMGKSNTQKWKCNAVGKLPEDAEKRSFEILQNAIVKNGGASDFKILRTFVEEDTSNFKVLGTRYISSKNEEIRLFFVLGHGQDYTDLEGRSKNGQICGIEFDFYILETSQESALTIGNEAEQEIKKYLSSSGLTLRQ